MSAGGVVAVDPAERRQRIVEALGVVISRSGFGGTRVPDVVREARTSMRTFYAEFDDKEACFLELHRQVTSQVVTLVGDSADFSQPWREAIRSGFRTYFSLLEAAPRLTYAIMVELASLGPAARLAREEAMDLFGAMLIDQIERGRAANPSVDARPLSPLMARGMLGAIMELVITWTVRDDAITVDELVDTCTEMLASLVVPGPLDALDAPAG